jgi:hypothetical protein
MKTLARLSDMPVIVYRGRQRTLTADEAGETDSELAVQAIQPLLDVAPVNSPAYPDATAGCGRWPCVPASNSTKFGSSPKPVSSAGC